MQSWRDVGAWCTSDAPRRAVYAAAAAFGLVVFVIVYGADHLVGASAFWQMPQQDEAMALIGYRYFLLEPWDWPVFASEAVNSPYPKSLAFLDCIPIWALVNKAIATVIPPWGDLTADAYLGLWHGLVYALQPCLAIACMRALGHRSWRAAAVTALIAIAVPTWIYRYGHAALSAHWIELWALYLYLRTPRGGEVPRRIGGAWLAQLAVGALVSPYHVALSFPIFAAALVRARKLRSAIWLPLGLAAAVGALWFAGYFASEIGRRQWGFEVQSANLLGWLIPQRSGIVGDAQWIVNVHATPWQYEGYAYLGLGVLVLLALALARPRSIRDAIARHPALFAVAVIAALFALSNHIYAGPHELWSYRFPRLLRWVMHQFRSPGRFVWIPTYVLVVFLLHHALAWASTWRRFALVGVAALLQLVDATGDWKLQRAMTASPGAQLADTPVWRDVVHAHRAVEILPPYSCVFHPEVAALDHVSRQLQLLASERALRINGTYSARDMRHCAAEEQAWATMPLAPDTLYVLLPPALAVADRFAAAGAACAAFPHGRVCSANARAIARLPQPDR